MLSDSIEPKIWLHQILDKRNSNIPHSNGEKVTLFQKAVGKYHFRLHFRYFGFHFAQRKGNNPCWMFNVLNYLWGVSAWRKIQWILGIKWTIHQTFRFRSAFSWKSKTANPMTRIEMLTSVGDVPETTRKDWNWQQLQCPIVSKFSRNSSVF